VAFDLFTLFRALRVEGDCEMEAKKLAINGVRMEEIMLIQIQRFARRLRPNQGQSLVEYALILALVSIVAILVLKGIGTSVNTKLSNVNGNLQ
jgi:Flp pilus assembly pilin Flp